MRKHLTDLQIQKLKAPTEGQIEVWDIQIPGLGLRVSKGGSKSFVLMFRHAGKLRRMTLGRYDPDAFPLRLARDKARDARRMVEEGMDPAFMKKQEQLEAREAPTIKDLAELYIERYAKRHKKSWKEDERMLTKDVIPEWGHLKAHSITRRDVIALLDDIVERGAGVTANRTLAVISRMFNFGVDRCILESNPAYRVKAPTPEKARERTLTEVEIREFWKALDSARMDEGTRIALKLVLVTGQRPGEVAGMSKKELDGNWWTIPGERIKNGLTHRVPLSPLAETLIKEAKALSGDSPYLFPSPSKDESDEDRPIGERALARAIANNRATGEKPDRAFKLDHFTPHDLRRTCGTMLGALVVSRFIQDRILNHKDRSMGGVYDRHSYDEQKRAALEAWSNKLEEITSGTKAENVVNLHA